LKNENQECIIKSAVGTSLYDITPTGRIVNLLLSGGDRMKILTSFLKWLISLLKKKKQPDIKIEAVNSIVNIIINHKD
jgi:L-lysine 2,3-aminomutase